MNYEIRELYPSEIPLLSDFLYEAIFQKDDSHPLPQTIIQNPDLQIYIRDFGKMEDDYCLCAEVDRKVVGAVWVRNIAGYGSIDDQTPEFAISLYKDFRGFGIGTDLMRQMLKHLKAAGYQSASLAVQKDNYAAKMYRSSGFQTIHENAEEYIMVHYF